MFYARSVPLILHSLLVLGFLSCIASVVTCFCAHCVHTSLLCLRRVVSLVSYHTPSPLLFSRIFFSIPFIARQAFVVLSFNDPLSLNPTSHPSFTFPFPLSARTRRRRHTFLAKNYPSHPSVHPFVEVPLLGSPFPS
jgi:hypothetical protein